MKKFLCTVLSAAMVFSVAPVTSFDSFITAEAAEQTIKSIKYTGPELSVYENTLGYNSVGNNDKEFYYYEPYKFFDFFSSNFEVSFTDGSKKEFIGSDLYGYYDLYGITSDNQWLYPWKVDGKNNYFYFDFYYNYDFNTPVSTIKIPVSIKKSNIKSLEWITKPDIEMWENYSGYMASSYDPVIEKEKEYYYYDYMYYFIDDNDCMIKVTYNDNTSKKIALKDMNIVQWSTEGNVLTIEGETGAFEFTDTQFNKKWLPGSSNTITIKYGGKSLSTNIKLREDDITKIEYAGKAPVIFNEGELVSWDWENIDENGNSSTIREYELDYSKLYVNVYYKNGKVVKTALTDFMKNLNTDLAGFYHDVYDNPSLWGPGNTNYIKAFVRNHECSVPFYVKPAKLPFKDVSKDAYYYSSIMNVFTKDIMNGKTETAFAPKDNLTRAQVVTMLWNMEGNPSASKESGFSDVNSSKYYAKAISWAKKNGIVNGYDNGKFGPNDTIKRQDFAAILKNYASYKKCDMRVSSATAYKNAKDYKDISNYALSAVNWAYDMNLIGANGTINPKGIISRADAAVMITRFEKML